MDLSDTIVAVSSAGGGTRSIVRLSGPDALSVCREIFDKPITLESNGIVSGSISIDKDLAVPVLAYLFFAPCSYTGQMLVELHITASDVLVEAMVAKLLAKGLRAAGPGEFTARAYLNGKLDLTGAEAVNEIIASSNRFQLDAAEKLLAGRMKETVGAIRSDLLDILSLIEAGLDFSEEDIEFISCQEASERLSRIKTDLQNLLNGSIQYESLIDLPSVGIAGAPNAGKSSLLNTLLGQDRSIVSEQAKTTRDVLSGLWTTSRFRCVLFDCAGLLALPDNPLDELAQQAAIEALKHCQVVLFCIDMTKSDFTEDRSVLKLIQPRKLLCIATKADLIEPEDISKAVERLTKSFNTTFTPISTKTAHGLDKLSQLVEHAITQSSETESNAIALTSRHKQIVSEAMENISQARSAIQEGDEEVTAMLVRAAYEGLSGIEQQHIDEQILDRVFGQFCIGK